MGIVQHQIKWLQPVDAQCSSAATIVGTNSSRKDVGFIGVAGVRMFHLSDLSKQSSSQSNDYRIPRSSLSPKRLLHCVQFFPLNIPDLE